MVRLLSICIFLLGFISANAETFVQGKDYVELSTENPASKAKPQVSEFFSFGCPGCFNLEAKLEPWLLQHKNAINFTRNPVVFHQGWETYAKAYYIAQSLDILNTAFPQIFAAVQKDKLPLYETPNMINFFIQKLHADKELVESAFQHSTAIDMQIQTSVNESVKFEIMLIPSFVVNNKYRTDLKMAKSPERLLAIVDELLKKS
ncbi:MAG: hypothetical protein A3F18_05955 [Legionellales bacterium RIFCSPHIGHO2_12_FULL_37_14]|nr:MAG: hypothetical protein A3F18_05955 [Legionellales bacterium RIFCSPHIGHO2_12_FULL_37_14]